MERVRSRGHVNKTAVFDSKSQAAEAPAAGAKVQADGKEVGHDHIGGIFTAHRIRWSLSASAKRKP